MYTPTYTTLEAALDAVEVAIKETIADNPDLADQEDTIAWDMTDAIAMDCDQATAQELRRVTRGEF